jgi:outer membrane immunogenic protein
MKTICLAGIAFIASCGAALAADAQAVVTPGPFSPPPAYPAVQSYPTPVVAPGPFSPPPAYPVVPVYDWTGFYVGINGGAAFGTTNWFSVPAIVGGSANLTSGLIGGTAGYNLQTGEPYVLGIEADLDWTGLKATTASLACAPNPACELSAPVFGTVRLRFGYAFDTILPYITGGVAIANFNADIAGAPFGTATSTNLGWTAGAGVEFAITNALRAKLEYLHADLNGFSCNVACGGGPVSFNVNSNIIRVGLNYRLWTN